jgi:DNA-binding response OmpR family regulator
MKTTKPPLAENRFHNRTPLPASTGHARVVLIDDSEIILASIKDALEEIGCDVVAVMEPTRACFAGENAPDLILLDVNMPQAFGDDIARFLRETWEISSQIYLYSSLSEEELKTRAREAGADGYICKSWGKARLLHEVREILSLPHPEGAAAGGGDLFREPPDLDEPQQALKSVRQRFARRCGERRAAILASLASDPTERTVRAITLQLHDFVGEAKLLGLDRVASAASSLKGLIEDRGIDLLAPHPRDRFERCLVQMTELAERMALEAPDAPLWEELQALRVELDTTPAPRDLELVRDERESQAPPQDIGSRRILVFDDSPIVGEVLSLELEDRGHKVALATCLTEFNQRLSEFDPELIFLDVAMPDISGPELCQHLRQSSQTQKLPIIFLSSLPEEQLAELAQRSGADGFLSKQRGMEELIKYLDDILEEIVF